MDGEGEDGAVVAKDVRGAVAVVDVGVDDDGFLDSALPLQAANGNRHIVNRAKPLAMVRMRVVKSAAQVAGKTVAQRQLAGENGSAGGQPYSFREFGRIRHFELHDLARGQRAMLELAHPFGGVDAKEVFIGGVYRILDGLRQG